LLVQIILLIVAHQYAYGFPIDARFATAGKLYGASAKALGGWGSS